MKYLLGYRAPEIELYRTDLKFFGRVVAVVGFVFLGYGALTLWHPLSGSIPAITFGTFLLGIVGVDHKKYKNKLFYEAKLLKMRLFR